MPKLIQILEYADQAVVGAVTHVVHDDILPFFEALLSAEKQALVTTILPMVESVALGAYQASVGKGMTITEKAAGVLTAVEQAVVTKGLDIAASTALTTAAVAVQKAEASSAAPAPAAPATPPVA